MKYYSSVFFLLIAPIWAQLPCTSVDISNMDVSSCICPSNFPSPPSSLICQGNSIDCPITCNPSPPSPVVPRAQLSQCYSGCVEPNSECNGCYIWFSSLCRCLQAFQSGSQTDCIASPVIGQGAPQPHQSPSWVVLGSGNLITTTQLIPGILQLQTAADIDGGFRLGQDTINAQQARDSLALAMNSVSTRSEEQIHIHLCDSTNSGIRGILDQLDRNKYRTSQSVPLAALHKSNSAMNCRVSPNSGVDINMGRDVVEWLKQYQGSNDCAQYDVGAGVITDSSDYTWACVTTGHRAAENLFCPT
ncbi:unnamed protein product [Penicillium olsonii]|nr:unnamed protein product [Penicillium olsonii]